MHRGFTLIELSIVLVIIGLIVGGVLVGRNLITAAQLRATITQIEKYNQAVNAFKGKYGQLPGDITDPDATRFGLIARGTAAGQGDGNGLIEGWGAAPGSHGGQIPSDGEPLVFWIDLSTTHMIDQNFTTAIFGYIPIGNANQTTNLYYPQASVGQGNYIYVWSGGPTVGPVSVGDGNNYFAISAVTQLYYYSSYSNPGLTVSQAYAMDLKLDDGFPQSGRVIAVYFNGNLPSWAGTGGTSGAPYTTATAGSSSTCFDNGNTAGAAQQYSVEQSSGNGVNCGLSFRFQ